MRHEIYQCRSCDFETESYRVRCPSCGALNSIVSVEAETLETSGEFLEEIADNETRRFESGLTGFDAALGGGFVYGSAVMLAGAPGCGKSTLALQAAAYSSLYHSTLYISAEEPPARLKERAGRLRLNVSNLRVSTVTDVNAIGRIVRDRSAVFVVADSLQMFYTDELKSRPGSPSQLSACAKRITEISRSYDCAILVIGHVTKTNQLSGPRFLEHCVDTMLTFVPRGKKRVLSATKNRFGPAFEKHLFTMTDTGLFDAETA